MSPVVAASTCSVFLVIIIIIIIINEFHRDASLTKTSGPLKSQLACHSHRLWTVMTLLAVVSLPVTTPGDTFQG